MMFKISTELGRLVEQRWNGGLLVLAGCAESPTKPTTTGGSSSGSGKVVTATPEDSYECDDDLILEPHQPEECIPPEPVEPPKPDPVIGTYRLYLNEFPGIQKVLRIHPNHRAAIDDDMNAYRWEKRVESYNFYYDTRVGHPEEYHFSLKLKDLEGEPDITAFGSKSRSYQFEGIRLSSDSDFLFDFYRVTIPPGKNVLDCVNIGRKEKQGIPFTLYKADYYKTDSADTLADCEALCLMHKSQGRAGQGANCRIAS